MGLSTLELLRLGQVAIGDAPVALGSAYADVFEQVPDFPEEPAFSWATLEDPERARIQHERFEVERTWLGLARCRIELEFREGRLRRVSSGDPEKSVAEPSAAARGGISRESDLPMSDEMESAWGGFRIDLKQHHRRVAELSQRLGAPSEEQELGPHDRYVRWCFAAVQLTALVESRTPSAGIAVALNDPR